MLTKLSESATIQLPKHIISLFSLSAGDELLCDTDGTAIRIIPKELNPKLRIDCFGQLTFGYAGKYLYASNKKACELLALLLMERGKPIRKQRLAETLWQDAEPENALDSIYKAVRCLQALGKREGFIMPVRADSGFMWLDMERVESDVIEFERLYASGRFADYEAAVELYRAPFLSKEFYEWLEQWQAFYDIRYMNMINALIESYRESNPNMARYYQSIQYKV
ncbi:MAG: hypothetical protein LBU36_02890 [Clostridiales bacterium]|jgi:two-component SAPR family response regulator|nr:hypothetical protein [Clostridiales bacterium]